MHVPCLLVCPFFQGVFVAVPSVVIKGRDLGKQKSNCLLKGLFIK